MKKYREFMKERTFSRLSFFIVFTATLLYIAFFIIKDIDKIAHVVFSGLGSVISALAPLWIGMVLAYLLNPLVEKIFSKLTAKMQISETKSKKTNKYKLISVLCSYLLILLIICAIIYGFAALIMGQVVFESFGQIVNKLTLWFAVYEQEFRQWASNLPSGVFSGYANDLINTFVNWLSSNLSSSGIVSHISNVSGMVINCAIGFMISIYLLIDKNFFIGMWNKFVALIFPKHYQKITSNLNEVNSILSNFIRGVMLDAFFVAILSSIGLTLLGLDFSIFIGIFAGICNVIPYFGPVLGMIPAFLVGTLTESIWQGLLAIAILLFVQQIDSNIIYPRVVGSSTGLRPLFVLLAVTIGGHYGGIPAMILAVPTAGIIQLYVGKWVSYRESQLASRDDESNKSKDETTIE